MSAKITKSKEWYEDSAIKEGDSEVGAGTHCVSSTGSVCKNCDHWQSEFERHGCSTIHSREDGYCYKHHDCRDDDDMCKDFTQNRKG